MLKEPNRQETFWGNMIYKQIIPETELLSQIKKNIDFSFIYNEVKDCYTPDFGRPAEDPVRMFKAILVKRLFNLSERELEKQVNYNLLVKHFLDYDVNDISFDYSLITVFEKRITSERLKRIFNRLLELIIDRGFLNKNEEQIVDATEIIANIAIPSTIGRINRTIMHLARALKKSDISGIEKYLKLAKDISSKLNREIKQQKLVEAVKVAKEILSRTQEVLKQNKIHPARRPIIESRKKLLERVLGENVIEKPNEEIVIQKEESPKIVNPVDTDARFGYKSEKKPFVGYKKHMALSKDSHYITESEITSGEISDAEKLIPIVKELKAKGLNPPKVITDGVYSTGENFRELNKEKVLLSSPTNKGGTKNGIYPPDDFEYDETNKTLKCPRDQITNICKDCPEENAIVFYFPRSVCKSCPARKNCTPNNSFRNHGRRVAINYFRKEYLKAKEYENTDLFKEDQVKRKIIEAKIAEEKRFHGLNRTEVCGIERVRFQAFLTDIVVNLKRFISDFNIRGSPTMQNPVYVFER